LAPMPGVTGEATDQNWSVEHVACISLGLDFGNVVGVRGGPSVRQSRAQPLKLEGGGAKKGHPRSALSPSN
jgi:hypothetical protein